jgi:hypothetical protein
MVAEVDVMDETATAEMTGVPAVVAKVELGEVADVPAELAETTSKL